MDDLRKILAASVPEIISGLIVASIIPVVTLLFSKIGIWSIAILILLATLFFLIGRTIVQRSKKISISVKRVSQLSQLSLNDSETGYCILLVDDDKETLHLIGLLLQRHGYKVIFASNALQAKKIIRTDHQIDLVITDLMMPYGNEITSTGELHGLDVVKEVRKHRKETPIIIFSIHDRRFLLENDFQHLKPFSFVGKPCHPNELLNRISLDLAKTPTHQDLINDEINLRKIELETGDVRERIQSLWVLGEIGHNDQSIPALLTQISQRDQNQKVRVAALRALENIQTKLKHHH